MREYNQQSLCGNSLQRDVYFFLSSCAKSRKALIAPWGNECVSLLSEFEVIFNFFIVLVWKDARLPLLLLRLMMTFIHPYITFLIHCCYSYILAILTISLSWGTVHHHHSRQNHHHHHYHLAVSSPSPIRKILITNILCVITPSADNWESTMPWRCDSSTYH